MNPLGWGDDMVRSFVLQTLDKFPQMSSRDLCKAVVNRSLKNDVYKAKDDITCGSVYFREPRKTIIATGPPYNNSRDSYLADMIRDFDGRKILCGGTTAQIISREFDEEVTVKLDEIYPNIPPESQMEGVDLITEGIITLSKVSEYLENKNQELKPDGNPAEKIVSTMIDSDIIHFVVGTRINEAHQDPNMPVELEIRRNIVKKIASTLQEVYLKEVILNFI